MKENIKTIYAWEWNLSKIGLENDIQKKFGKI